MVSQGRPISARATAYEIADDGVDELGPWLKGRPWAMPFLSNVADATLAASFSPRYLWGIDQEFVGAPAILLDLLAKWKAIDKAALDAGQFDKIMLQTARPAYFADLRTRFKDSVALTAIGEAMEKRAYIYQLDETGRYLENNEVRAALMRSYFLRARDGEKPAAPTVLLKMGRNHVGRGATPTSSYDLGSLLPGLAAANGKTSLHIAYVPLGGTVRNGKPTPTAFTELAPYKDEPVGPIFAAAGIAPDSLPATGHVLIPLAPLRHKFQGKAMRDLPVYARFTLLGFDYLATTRDAKPATHFEAR